MATRPAMPTVLVVDDDRGVRNITRRTLEQAGFNVWEAADGIEALNLINTGMVSLVVTDIRMPGMDGWQLAAVLKTMTPPKPILFVSAYAAHLGSVSFPGPVIAKPFRGAQLIEEVRRLLGEMQPRTA
jgi:CheY-like chemotaxis protein